MKRSPLWVILAVAFVDLVGFGLIIPLQANYAERLHATGFIFGLLVGSYALMQLVFNPILGRWSDRVGRRRVLIISIGGSVASHLLLGVADLAGSLTLLFVARVLDGITGANIATAQAYIADVTTGENRARGMGLFGAAFGLGFIAGPALGAALAFVGRTVSGPMYGTAWPAFGAVVASLIALFLVWRFLPESRPAADPAPQRTQVASLAALRALVVHPRLRELFVIVFFSIFAFVLMEVTIVYLCVRGLGVAETGTGMIFAYMGVLMVLVQGGLVGRLARRFGEATLVATGPFVTAIGFLMFSGIPLVDAGYTAWLLLIAGAVPLSLGQGLTGPNLNALVSRQTDEGRHGTTLGFSQGVGSLGRAIAPPIGGILYDRGMSLPYWVGAVILALVGIFAIRIRGRQQRAVEAREG